MAVYGIGLSRCWSLVLQRRWDSMPNQKSRCKGGYLGWMNPWEMTGTETQREKREILEYMLDCVIDTHGTELSSLLAKALAT